MVKKAVRLIFIVLFIVLAIFTRTFFQQYKEFKKGESAYLSKSFQEATTYYESAIHMYTPLSPFVEQSIERMKEIAQNFEKTNDYRWALITYENLRSAIYSVRSFYLPYSEVITLCDSKISELVKKTEQ